VRMNSALPSLLPLSIPRCSLTSTGLGMKTIGNPPPATLSYSMVGQLFGKVTCSRLLCSLQWRLNTWPSLRPPRRPHGYVVFSRNSTTMDRLFHLRNLPSSTPTTKVPWPSPRTPSLMLDRSTSILDTFIHEAIDTKTLPDEH
jgi:hypothetical protein